MDNRTVLKKYQDSSINQISVADNGNKISGSFFTSENISPPEVIKALEKVDLNTCAQIPPDLSKSFAKKIKGAKNIIELFSVLNRILKYEYFPDVNIFAELISKCSEFNLIDYAQEIYAVTLSKQYYHDLIFNSMIVAATKRGDLKSAKEVYADYNERVKQNKFPTNSIEKIVHHTMMDTLVKFNKIQDARDVNDKSGIRKENEDKFSIKNEDRMISLNNQTLNFHGYNYGSVYIALFDLLEKAKLPILELKIIYGMVMVVRY